MASEIHEFVMAQPLFDTHEHLCPMADAAETLSTPNGVGGYANADLETARGPCPLDAPPPPAPHTPEFTKYFFDAWTLARNTGYCQAIERACPELTGHEFTRDNWSAIKASISEQITPDPAAWYVETLRDKAGVKWAIKDSINLPGQAADGLYPEFVRFNYREDELLVLLSRSQVAAHEVRWQRAIHSLDQLVDGLMASISQCLATGKVTCFKIGVAYSRDLTFANATRHDAERAFNRLMSVRHGERDEPALTPAKYARLSGRQLRPLHDYLTHQYVRRATDEGLPIQIHTGYLAGNYSELGNINPLQLTPLLRQYPRTRFDLFHAGWPYHDLLGTIGKHYPNAWINLCWAWTMSPVSMEHALDSWLDSVPYSKIFAFGGDTTTPFTTYAYAMQARAGIARVLDRRIARGAMDAALARAVARAIMLENGEAFHALHTGP